MTLIKSMGLGIDEPPPKNITTIQIRYLHRTEDT